MMTASYEVVLGPAVRSYVLGCDRSARRALAKSLRTELQDGPNAETTAQLSDLGYVGYNGTPLTYRGFVAVYRRLERAELRRIERQEGRRTFSAGYLVAAL